MATNSVREQEAVFLLSILLGYDHRPEFVNEHNASYRSDVEMLTEVLSKWAAARGACEMLAAKAEHAAALAAAEGAPTREQCPVCHVEAIPATWWKCPCCGWLKQREGQAALRREGQ